MALTTPAIAARIIGASPTRYFGQRGVVERQTGETTFRIRFPSGSIEVKVETGKLREDDTVFLYRNRTDGTVLVQKIDAVDGAKRSIEQVAECDTYAAAKLIESSPVCRLNVLLCRVLDIIAEPNAGTALSQLALVLSKEIDGFDEHLSAAQRQLVRSVVEQIEKTAQAPNAITIEELKVAVERAIELVGREGQARSPQIEFSPIHFLPPGLYHFEKVADALSWLEKAGMSEHSHFPLPTDGPVIVEVKSRAANDVVAVLYFQSEGETAVSRFIRNYACSNVWELLGAEVLVHKLQTAGTISIPRLLLADSLLLAHATEHSFPFTARLGLEQLVSMVIDTSLPVKSILEFSTLPSAAEIIEQYENLRQRALLELGRSDGPDVVDLIFDPAAAGHQNKGEQLLAVLQKMGLTLERDLLSLSASMQGENMNRDQTAKATLLSLRAAIENGGEARLTPLEGVEPTETVPPKYVLRVVSEILSLVDVMIVFFTELRWPYWRPPTQSVMAQQSPSAPAQTIVTGNGAESIEQAFDIDAPCRWMWGDRTIEDALSRVLTLVARLLVSTNVSTPISEELARAIWLRIEFLSTAAEREGTPTQEIISIPPSPNSNSGFISPRPHTVFEAFEILLDILRVVLNQSRTEKKGGRGGEIEAFALAMEKQMERFLKEMGIQVEKGGYAKMFSASDLFLRDIDAALRKLDSLQIISRPLSTSTDTTTQVVTFPVRMGDSLVEVPTKLITKKHRHKKGRGGSRYTVELNVSPRYVGDVKTTMEYIPKKSLHIRLACGREKAVEWFVNNRKKFIASLQAIGLPVSSVDVGGIDRKVRQRRDRYGVKPDDRVIIDMCI